MSTILDFSGDTLCNRPPEINLIRGKFILGQEAKKELGGPKFIRGITVLGYSEILPLLKKNYVGATKNNTGGTFEN